jgi:hypothetical protein
MYNHVRRIAKLEKQFGTVESESPLLLVVSRIGCPLALDEDRCVEILGESGFLPRGPAMGVVNLGRMPKGLNAKETESYLRENGSEICGFGTAGR